MRPQPRYRATAPAPVPRSVWIVAVMTAATLLAAVLVTGAKLWEYRAAPVAWVAYTSWVVGLVIIGWYIVRGDKR